MLDNLASLGNDLVVVALGGAGHAARVAVDAQSAVSDLLLVGTPLGPVSLSALTTQPAADALRLLHALLPPTRARRSPTTTTWPSAGTSSTAYSASATSPTLPPTCGRRSPSRQQYAPG